MSMQLLPSQYLRSQQLRCHRLRKVKNYFDDFVCPRLHKHTLFGNIKLNLLLLSFIVLFKSKKNYCLPVYPRTHVFCKYLSNCFQLSLKGQRHKIFHTIIFIKNFTWALYGEAKTVPRKFFGYRKDICIKRASMQSTLCQRSQLQHQHDVSVDVDYSDTLLAYQGLHGHCDSIVNDYVDTVSTQSLTTRTMCQRSQQLY